MGGKQFTVKDRLKTHTDRQTKYTDRLMIQTDRLKHRQKDYETERLMTQKINGIDRRYRHRLKTQKHRLTDGQKIEIDQSLIDQIPTQTGKRKRDILTETQPKYIDRGLTER